MSASTFLSSLVDMFTYPLRHTHYLELVNPLWNRQVLKAKVVAILDDTADTRTLTLMPGRGWRDHRAGQFVRIGVPIGGRRHTRTYSISSAPARADGCIDITVKAVEGGHVSQYLVRQTKVGQYLPLAEPQGDFVLPEAMPVHPLFITGGSGITPVMSILRAYVDEYEVMPDISHMHYAPTERDLIFGGELQQLDRVQQNYHLNTFYTRAGDAHFNAAQLELACPDWREREVWACGPAGLLDAVEAHWAQAGLANRVHTERFHAQTVAPPADGVQAGKVIFMASAVEAPSDGSTSLLNIAENAGLNPAHGCRMGICHGCNTTLASGCARDTRTGKLITEVGDVVQICVCTAVGDIALAI
jgi:ferredoxin-NADP reductase